MTRQTAGGLTETAAGCIYDLAPQTTWCSSPSGGSSLGPVRVRGAPGGHRCRPGDGPATALRVLQPHLGAPVGTILVRDLDQAFYHRGVRGLGDSIDEVVGALRTILDHRRRVVFVGQSAGGYAALLFGAALGVQGILAFAPQSFLSRRLCRRYADDRYTIRMQEVYRVPREHRYLDTRTVSRRNHGRTSVRLYYGQGNHLDTLHCARLGHLPNVTLHPTDTASHAVARRMREDGSLKRVVGDSLGLSPAPVEG